MTRYEAIEKALQKLIADYESEIHDNYDGTSFLSYRMAEVHDAKDALALPEDSKVVNAELDLPNAELYSPTVAIEWISEVFPEWTTLQIMANGTAFAFNRVNGKVYKIPDPNVPFIQMTEQYKVVREGDKVRFE